MRVGADDHLIRWPRGWAVVSTTAAMLVDGGFMLETGPFEPFARAPWHGSLCGSSLPGHLRRLGAEFVAVPFGSASVPDGIVGKWDEFAGMTPIDPPHGPSADDTWSVTEHSESRIALALDYPEHSAVARLERTISGDFEAAALCFELTIYARRDARIAVGLHPILRLPNEVGQLEVSVDFEQGYTYPWAITRAVSSRLAHARSFTNLGEVPAASGGETTIDKSRFPSNIPSEEIVQLCAVSSPVTAYFRDQGAALVLDWDRTLLPSLMLWHSDRGLGDEPWRHSYRGLGIEPVAAAFDLPPAVSEGSNPLLKAGHATSIAISPTAPTVIRYSIGASPVAASPRQYESPHEN